MPDVFPNDLMGEIRALQKRVEDLEAQLKSRPALTEASQGWIMRGMAAPDTGSMPATDGRIYIKGGRLTFRPGGNGSEVQLRPPVTIG
ncbi:hypothetical protein ACWEJ6_20925, partial [Nonomuraea sp. NPDC004702]